MIQFWIQPRQSGKTTKSIIKAVAEDLLIVCANNGTRRRTSDMLKKYVKDNNITKKFYTPVTWSEYINKINMTCIRPKGVIIEDLECCITALSEFPIIAVTATCASDNGDCQQEEMSSRECPL